MTITNYNQFLSSTMTNGGTNAGRVTATIKVEWVELHISSVHYILDGFYMGLPLPTIKGSVLLPYEKFRLTMSASHGPKCPSYMGQYGLPLTTAAVTHSYYAPRNLPTTRTGFIGALQPKIWLSTLSTTRR